MEFAKSPPSRSICLRETDENFYIAVNRSYPEQSGGYQRLAHLASGAAVHSLDEGSQVFVYPREAFDPDRHPNYDSDVINDKDLLLHRVMQSAGCTGGVIVDPLIERVEDKVPPRSLS